jgi:hypothetical protein
VALWQLHFETGHWHGDFLINRTTGSGRERQFAATPSSRRSTRGPLPANVSFLAPMRTHTFGHQLTVATGSFLESHRGMPSPLAIS